ncbi:MAG: prephenate dehydrogenase/arogenate dehydrogenase family protein [Thiotrichaceae bacterium]|nr:prephenate dehydrogenase/arogenate dehydrogenase family protein [Thiotrichaceae bacterium]
MFISKLTIIGVGLIGGSFARALRHAGLVGKVTGCGRDVANLETALALGIIDDYSVDVAEAVRDADLVVVAVPLMAMGKIFAAMRPALAPHALITDVGSVKACVIEAARENLAEHFPRFVAGHPIAGAEKTGAAASFTELFHQRRIVLTPTAETDKQALHQVSEYWLKTGANVIEMSAEQHDLILAATSHLPHVLAFTVVNTLAGMQTEEDVFQFAAGGFRDFSRIASSDPQMWHDICLSNPQAILSIIESFEQHLHQLRDAVIQKDSHRLLALLRHAKTLRDKFVG